MNEKLSIALEEQFLTLLSKNDLIQAISFINKCLHCASDEEFNNLLLSFSAFLKFEFVLYCYTQEYYENDDSVHFENLSNPEEWAAEYNRDGLLLHDPVRHEVERLLAIGTQSAFISWDKYVWKLSAAEQKVIERRKSYGLNYGFSVFANSERKDFFFLFSFASKKTLVEPRLELLAKLLVQQLMATRKRLDMQNLISKLSDKEKLVARWVMEGKTNWEISQIINIKENTVKYHTKNIFSKLQISNRQQASAVLLAERYLCP